MTEKFLKLHKKGEPIQRLFGPKARDVYEKEWKPAGWLIVGEPVVVAAPVQDKEEEAEEAPVKSSPKTAKVPM